MIYFINIHNFEDLFLGFKKIIILKWGLGIGGLGIGDWGLGTGPNPQSPIPNPQSPIPNPHFKYIIFILIKNL